MGRMVVGPSHLCSKEKSSLTIDNITPPSTRNEAINRE